MAYKSNTGNNSSITNDFGIQLNAEQASTSVLLMAGVWCVGVYYPGLRSHNGGRHNGQPPSPFCPVFPNFVLCEECSVVSYNEFVTNVPGPLVRDKPVRVPQFKRLYCNNCADSNFFLACKETPKFKRVLPNTRFFVHRRS